FLNSSSRSLRLPPIHTLFPYTTLFRSRQDRAFRSPKHPCVMGLRILRSISLQGGGSCTAPPRSAMRATSSDYRLHPAALVHRQSDRKSTRLNSSHVSISYAVFCLKKKK